MARQLDLDVLVPEDIEIALHGRKYVIKGDYLTTEKSLEIRKVQEAMVEDQMNLAPLVEFAKKVLKDNNTYLAEVKDFSLTTKQAYAIFELLAKEVYLIEEIQLDPETEQDLQESASELVRPLKAPQDHKAKIKK
jgi:hypothetical protein